MVRTASVIRADDGGNTQLSNADLLHPDYPALCPRRRLDRYATLQIAGVAVMAIVAAVCGYPYPGYEAGVIEGHGLSLEGHGLALDGAAGLEGHAVGSYGAHGLETEHDVGYYASILI